MNFLAVVPFGGYHGWSFLERTREDQQERLAQSPEVARDVARFSERIGDVKTAADLVSDRQVLKVALGAFGLEADLENRYFVEKILSSDLGDKTSLANRLNDKRYKEMAQAFDFAGFRGPRTDTPSFTEKITSSYVERSFEVAVGEQNTDMRLALGLERDLGDLAAKDMSDNAKWFNIMANPPLRKVFETALGLPQSFGTIDLDQQLGEFRSRAERMFGTSEIAEIAQKETRDELTRTFLARSQISAMQSAGLTGTSAALQLLQS